MIDIKITVYADELIFRLDTLPKRLRDTLRAKFIDIFSRVEEEVFRSTPGKYLDPMALKSDTVSQGLQEIGFIEYDDKPGFYRIYPSKARLLRFIGGAGDVVYTPRVLYHPFPKGAPVIEQVLRQSKPWILDELETAAYEAL